MVFREQNMKNSKTPKAMWRAITNGRKEITGYIWMYRSFDCFGKLIYVTIPGASPFVSGRSVPEFVPQF